MDNTWQEYTEALSECAKAVRLAAEKTEEAAQYAEDAAHYSLLSIYHIKEYIKVIRRVE